MKSSESNRIKTFDTVMRKSKAKNYIDTEFKKLEDKYKFHSRMFTLVHDPNEVTAEQAWGWVFFDIEKIKKIVTDKKNNILFSIISVEMHMSKGKCLTGYPHLHLVLYRTSEGKLENFNSIHSLLRTETSFGRTGEDIRIDGDTKKKGKRLDKSNISFLCYALKNSKHEEPYMKLKNAYEKYKDRLVGVKTTADSCLLIDNSEDKEVIDFFVELTKRNIIINIPEEKLNLTTVQPKKMLVEHEDNGTKKVSPAEAKFKLTFSMIWNYMQENELRLCKNDQVYKKKKGTRRTWEYWGSLDRIIGGLYTMDNFSVVHDILINEEKIKKMAQKEEQQLIPRININWYYVEFKDFYLHIPSYSIVRGELDPEIELGLSNSGMSFDQLRKQELPKVWLSVIENQKFGRDITELSNFCVAYYSVLMPLVQKARVLCLLGVSNSGKSSVLEPMKRFFPKNVTTEITEGQFAFGTIPDKRLVCLDDVKNKALEDGNMLQLLEGGRDIMINQKHATQKMEEFKGNICISTNSIPESWQEFSRELDEFVLKKEFEMRLKIFRFETAIKDPKPGFLKDMETKEIAKVIMFTGNEYAKRFLGKQETNGSCLTYYENFNECRDKFHDSECLFGY
jgi:hypothetical protein